MCDWEEFLFSCNHSVLRLKSYCHSARNDPVHRCDRVKVLRSSWLQGVPCEHCIRAIQEEARQGPHGQGPGRTPWAFQTGA